MEHLHAKHGAILHVTIFLFNVVKLTVDRVTWRGGDEVMSPGSPTLPITKSPSLFS